MNDTPRTDALRTKLHEKINTPNIVKYMETILHANTLETELTAAREELKTAIGQRDAIEESRVMTSNIYIKTAEQRDRLADLVKQFISILDITEESDGGRLFHPTNITSCRAGDLQKIGELVEALRRASKTTNPNAKP